MTFVNIKALDTYQQWGLAHQTHLANEPLIAKNEEIARQNEFIEQANKDRQRINDNIAAKQKEIQEYNDSLEALNEQVDEDNGLIEEQNEAIAQYNATLPEGEEPKPLVPLKTRYEPMEPLDKQPQELEQLKTLIELYTVQSFADATFSRIASNWWLSCQQYGLEKQVIPKLMSLTIEEQFALRTQYEIPNVIPDEYLAQLQ